MWNLQNLRFCSYLVLILQIPSYICHISMNCSVSGADEEDRDFWAQAAVASRKYLVQACSPITGMSAEYAEFDGSPMSRKLGWSNDRHDWFYSDFYRTAANIGLDYEWFGIDEGQCAAVDRLQEFLLEDARRNQFHTYEINGTVAQSDVLHPVAIIATVAQGSLAANNPFTNEWIERFWNTPMRTGVRRYYDNCLYFFAFLALSGKYRIW